MVVTRWSAVCGRKAEFFSVYLLFIFFNTAIVFEPLTQGVLKGKKSIFIQEQLICI